MGNFGYICKGCGTPINIDEKCVLIHVRHGEELGRTEGHYDGYGRVEEDTIYRNDDNKNINSHENIWLSEFHLNDSVYKNCGYNPEGKSGTVAFHSACKHKVIDELTPSDSDPNQSWGRARKKYL